MLTRLSHIVLKVKKKRLLFLQVWKSCPTSSECGAAETSWKSLKCSPALCGCDQTAAVPPPVCQDELRLREEDDSVLLRLGGASIGDARLLAACRGTPPPLPASPPLMSPVGLSQP